MKRKILAALLCAIVLTGCEGKKENSNTESQRELNTSQWDTSQWETFHREKETEEEDWVTEEKKWKPAVVEYRDKEVARAYREVLKSERSFVSIDEGNTETYLNEFDYFLGNQECELTTKGFRVFDFNEDDNYEIEVTLYTSQGYDNYASEILFYEDGVVYGIQLPKWVYLYGGKIVSWDNIDHPTYSHEKDDPYYTGYARIQIENREIIYTYLFEKEGSPEEKWLRDSGMMGEKDRIEYLGKEYEHQCFQQFKYDDWYELCYNSRGDYIGYKRVDQYIR